MNRLFILLYLMVSISDCVTAQGTAPFIVSSEGDTVILKSIPIVDINAKIEELSVELTKINRDAEPTEAIIRIDTTLKLAQELLDAEKERINQSEQELSMRSLDDITRQWSEYDKTLFSWQTIVTSRLQELETMLFNLDIIDNTWKLTKEEAQKQQAPPTSIKRISEVIANVASAKKEVKNRKDAVLLIQSKITDFQIEVNKVSGQLMEIRKTIQSAIFAKDSPALWNLSDSTINKSGLAYQIRRSTGENTRQIQTFIENNSGKLIKHIILFIIYLLIFYFLNKWHQKSRLDKNDSSDQDHYILSNYFPSALFLTLVSSLLIYRALPTALTELIKILLVIPALWLIPGMINPKYRPLLITLVIVFVFDLLMIFFIPKSLYSRILLMITNLVTFWLVNQFGNKNNAFYALAGKNLKIAIRILLPIYFLFLTVAILGNIAGYVDLSALLIKAIINSIMIAVLLYLMYVVISVLIRALLETPLLKLSYIVSNHAATIRQKADVVIKYLAVFLWFRGVFNSLGLLKQVSSWFAGLMDVKWEVKNIDISLGGIIGFFLVIFITWFIVRLLRYLMEEEIFPRIKLARGVPGAISMIIRYSIVAFGIYIAISAAGIDLDRFGLIAGALGVGIGFGLQGVVYNFIAGLILAFERPIQKGDTIEVGTLMGDVINIGVRSSTIRTYDGSEVIVPNGNLISNEVTNWTLSDRKRRRVVPVGVSYGSNPRAVMKLLEETTAKHPEVLPFPKPWPLFDGFGDNSLKFRILFWVDFDRGLSVQSEVAMMIHDALQDQGIQIPFPQQDIFIKNFDPTIQKSRFPGDKPDITNQ